MSKTTAKYVAQIVPDIDKRGMTKFYDKMKGMAKKSKEIWDKTFTLKNTLIGGGAVAGVISALKMSSSKVSEVGNFATTQATEAKEIADMGRVLGLGAGKFQTLMDFFGLRGVAMTEIKENIIEYLNAVKEGKIGGEATGEGYLEFLGSIIDAEGFLKKREIASSAMGEESIKKIFFPLSALSRADVEKLKGEIMRGKTFEEIGVSTQALGDLGTQAQIEQNKIALKNREALSEKALKSPEELLRAMTMENKSTSESLMMSLKELNSHLTNAELEKQGTQLLMKGLTEVLKTLASAIKYFKNPFSGA